MIPLRLAAALAAGFLHAAVAAAMVSLGGGGTLALDEGHGDDELTLVATVATGGPASIGPDAFDTEQTAASAGTASRATESRPDEASIEAARDVDGDLPATPEAKRTPTDETVSAAPAPPSPPRDEARTTTRDAEARAARDLSLYDLGVHRHLSRSALRPKGDERGRVLVEITIGATGELLADRILESSGNAVLDAAAEATVRRAAPFAPPPQRTASGGTRVLTIPFDYVGRRR